LGQIGGLVSWAFRRVAPRKIGLRSGFWKKVEGHLADFRYRIRAQVSSQLLK
jgi:hypothetical protein